MGKLALAGLFCFLAGAAWTAIVLAEIARKASTPGIGAVAGALWGAELLCLVGFALLAAAGLLALARTIRRRFNA